MRQDINAWLDLGSWDNLGNVVSLLLIAAMVVAFWRASRSDKSQISIEDMFVDETGHIGNSKTRLNGAFIFASWALVYETLHGNLTEWLLAAYLTAFVADRVSSRLVTKPEQGEKKDV